MPVKVFPTEDPLSRNVPWLQTTKEQNGEKKSYPTAQEWFSPFLPFSLHPGHPKVRSATPLWPGGCQDVQYHHRFKAMETNCKAKQPKQIFPPEACFFLAFIIVTTHLTNATPCDTYACHSCYGASPTSTGVSAFALLSESIL